MGQYIVCCGMSRSAGTAQYQMTRALVERHGLGGGDGFGMHYYPGKRPDKWVVVKVERAMPKWLEAVRDGRGVALGIYRDPRDVAASLMEFRRRQAELWPRAEERDGTFGDILPDLCDALEWWKEWEPLCSYMVPYEMAVMNWPREVVHMAAALGIETDGMEAIEIAADWCVQRNAQRCEEQKQWISSNDTMLTRAHVGTRMGAIGRWREDLSDAAARLVEQIAGRDWMQAHGYSLLDS